MDGLTDGRTFDWQSGCINFAIQDNVVTFFSCGGPVCNCLNQISSGFCVLEIMKIGTFFMELFEKWKGIFFQCRTDTRVCLLMWLIWILCEPVFSEEDGGYIRAKVIRSTLRWHVRCIKSVDDKQAASSLCTADNRCSVDGEQTRWLHRSHQTYICCGSRMCEISAHSSYTASIHGSY